MGRNDEDLELIARCIAGEPGAWRQFVTRFAPTLKALARRFLKLYDPHPDEGEIEDVLQEVFRDLIRRDHRLLRRYDPTYTVKTYLGVITRSQVHRALRRRKGGLQTSGEIEQLGPATDGGTNEVERLEETDLMMRALNRLPARDAEILRLRYIRELDYRTIAASLRIPESSVGQTLTRAKHKLLQMVRLIAGTSRRDEERAKQGTSGVPGPLPLSPSRDQHEPNS